MVEECASAHEFDLDRTNCRGNKSVHSVGHDRCSLLYPAENPPEYPGSSADCLHCLQSAPVYRVKHRSPDQVLGAACYLSASGMYPCCRYGLP